MFYIIQFTQNNIYKLELDLNLSSIRDNGFLIIEFSSDSFVNPPNISGDLDQMLLNNTSQNKYSIKIPFIIDIPTPINQNNNNDNQNNKSPNNPISINQLILTIILIMGIFLSINAVLFVRKKRTINKNIINVRNQKELIRTNKIPLTKKLKTNTQNLKSSNTPKNTPKIEFKKDNENIFYSKDLIIKEFNELYQKINKE